MSSIPTSPLPLAAGATVFARHRSTTACDIISFWRAAAIVLNDLASSAYYAVAKRGFVGKTAQWFILAIMVSRTRCAPCT